MKYLFYLGHPAHFHLFKNTIRTLRSNNTIFIVIKNKDVLKSLLDCEGFNYYDILPKGRRSTRSGLMFSLIKREIRLLRFCIVHRPDLMIGTSSEITHIGKILNIPSIVLEEDDYEVIPQFAKITYPFASIIMTPLCCSTGKWENKTIKYNSYHELAYLHPKYFSPNPEILKKLDCSGNDYFILRFVNLNANHDKGIKGINDSLASEIVQILRSYGKIFITTERKMEPDFDRYRITLKTSEILDAIYYARLLIGDSQTMSAEAGILGTPYIRVNDFVGRIGYLEELEHKYEVGFGIKPCDKKLIIKKIKDLLAINDLKCRWQKKAEEICNDKIDLTSFIIWFLQNYFCSQSELKVNPDYHTDSEHALRIKDEP